MMFRMTLGLFLADSDSTYKLKWNTLFYLFKAKRQKRHQHNKSSIFLKPPWLAECVKAPYILYGNLRRFEPTQGGKLIANACNQKPFEPREWGLKVVLSLHFCAILHVGHAKRTRPLLTCRNTSGSPDQNKTNIIF